MTDVPCTKCGRLRKSRSGGRLPSDVCHWCKVKDRKAAAAEGLEARFFAMTREGPPPAHRPELGACLLWTGSIVKETGYGRFNMGREIGVKGAHVVAFFIADGRWPDPFACHHCDIRHCVRRAHIFEGSAADNNRDMAEKGRSTKGRIRKTHCPNGHPYAGDNLYVDVRGHRVCRACMSDRKRAKATKRRARLTEALVLEIRGAVAGGESLTSVARRYGIGVPTASNVVNRISWRHVP